jgi:peptidoglycan/xylan/chitin deacetylase (PgdA/CDA1 family)
MSKAAQKRGLKKRKSPRVKTRPKWISLLVGLIAILVIVSFFMFNNGLSFQIKTIVDSPKTEMKKIPNDVKRQHVQLNFPTSFKVPVLIYHYVEYVTDKRDTIRQSLNINPFIFDQQVKTLVDAGYTFMTAKDLAGVLDEKNEMPQKPVLLTFDDGHWDIYTDVLPILKKYHARATVYVISGFTGGSDFMTKKQMEAVLKSGLVEIGAHTVHHVSLKNIYQNILEKEVNDSKSMLEKTYGISVVSFAYPNGVFDKQTIEVVKKAGFKTAVSTIPGTEVNQNNRYYIYRLHPGGKTGKILLDYLQQKGF